MTEIRSSGDVPPSKMPGGIGWLLSGFVLSLTSAGYYRSAARRRTGLVLLFFFLFALSLATLTTASLFMGIWPLAGEITTDWNIPEITIRNGVTTVDGPEPVVVFNDPGQMFIAIDTTGRIGSIPGGYQSGLLLTRTELHMVSSSNGYQVLPLRDVQQAFDADPMVINAETVARAWRQFSVILTVAAFFGLLIWHAVIRLMLLLLMGLVMWGIMSLIRPGTDFGPVLNVGLFAYVPATYLNHLLTLAGVTLPFQMMVLTALSWGTALALTYANIPALAGERPARLWRAWLGAPMLLTFAGLMFLSSTYAVLITWVVAGLTFLVLAGVSLFGSDLFSPAETPPAGMA